MTFAPRTTRRRLIEVGCLSPLALSWTSLLRARKASPSHRATAQSCVVIFLWGGPGQQDLWDPKPDAPQEQRGEFKPISTKVAGTQIGEHLPKLSQQTDKFTIIRSVTHRDFEHGSAAYTALTGHPHPRPGTNTPARPEDFPTYGAVVSELRDNTSPVPDAVVLGPVMHQGNRPPIAGQNAGFLGLAREPFRIASDPNSADFAVEELDPLPGISSQRLARRAQLFTQLARRSPSTHIPNDGGDVTALYERGFGLLNSQATQRAFRLGDEPTHCRDAYGRTRFGQSLLLTRRLVEAGVPLITINWSKKNNDQWDTHQNNYPRLRKMLPPFDAGLAAFFADLDERGLLDSTLVICLGEFGRTPNMNKEAGRDHWPDCYSIVMGGGGIRRGTVYGASNRLAAYPKIDDVGPWDLAATLFHCLGIPPDSHVSDATGRPFVVSPGRIVEGLL